MRDLGNTELNSVNVEKQIFANEHIRKLIGNYNDNTEVKTHRGLNVLQRQESPLGTLTDRSDPPHPLGFTNVSAILYLYEPA